MITFNELGKELELTSKYEQDALLDALEAWCFNHISRDRQYAGSPAEKYQEYQALAKDYLDVFLPSGSPDPSTTLPILGDLNAVQYAARFGYDHFLNEENIVTNDLLNKPDKTGMTPLHLAAIQGYVHTVDVLLAKGADPTIANQQAQLPIHSALFVPMLHEHDLLSKKEAIVYSLLSHAPGTIACQDESGDSIFQLMAVHGFDTLMSDLLNKYPHGVFQQNNHAHYPIHTAILNNQLGIATQLLAIDKVPMLHDAKGRRALHYAARCGTKEMVSACCRVMPDVNVQDSEGKTPLDLAKAAKNSDAVEILIKYGEKRHD